MVSEAGGVDNPRMPSPPIQHSESTRPPLGVGRDISGRLVFLGTGTSTGVPLVGCGCETCTSGDLRDIRTRTSALLGLPGGHLLIDTTPDLRSQLLREKIGRVDAVLFTHDHVDHVYGLDDLRPLCFATGRSIPLHCEERVENRIRKAFDYAFAPGPPLGGGVPKVTFERIPPMPFELLGAAVTPLRLRHGVFDVLGFRFGNVLRFGGAVAVLAQEARHQPADLIADGRDGIAVEAAAGFYVAE
jgi:phosphoribosyl 1,2-cyclic phosphate phosphodiesterase